MVGNLGSYRAMSQYLNFRLELQPTEDFKRAMFDIQESMYFVHAGIAIIGSYCSTGAIHGRRGYSVVASCNFQCGFR